MKTIRKESNMNCGFITGAWLFTEMCTFLCPQLRRKKLGSKKLGEHIALDLSVHLSRI